MEQASGRVSDSRLEASNQERTMLANQLSLFRGTLITVIFLGLIGCGHDVYKQRTEMIQAHAGAFQTNLKANRVEAAIYENEEIEAMASQVADAIRQRTQPVASDRVDPEWKLLKTAIDAAVGNWLALGRHLAMNKQYNQARFAYQRIIDTYTGETERPYRERAARAKRDIDILNPPSISTSGPGL
jgi:hypothetical protein